MNPRLTPAKVALWTKRLDSAHITLTAVLDEVNLQTGNAKAKHYQDLCDLRTDLRRVNERVELCLQEAGRIRA